MDAAAVDVHRAEKQERQEQRQEHQAQQGPTSPGTSGRKYATWRSRPRVDLVASMTMPPGYRATEITSSTVRRVDRRDPARDRGAAALTTAARPWRYGQASLAMDIRLATTTRPAM